VYISKITFYNTFLDFLKFIKGIMKLNKCSKNTFENINKVKICLKKYIYASKESLMEKNSLNDILFLTFKTIIVLLIILKRQQN